MVLRYIQGSDWGRFWADPGRLAEYYVGLMEEMAMQAVIRIVFNSANPTINRP